MDRRYVASEFDRLLADARKLVGAEVRVMFKDGSDVRGVLLDASRSSTKGGGGKPSMVGWVFVEVESPDEVSDELCFWPHIERVEVLRIQDPVEDDAEASTE